MTKSIYELEQELKYRKQDNTITVTIPRQEGDFNNLIFDKDSIILTWTGLYKPHQS